LYILCVAIIYVGLKWEDLYVQSSSVGVGRKSLSKSPLKDIVNALHEAEFADADWELLGMQLSVSRTQLDNIR